MRKLRHSEVKHLVPGHRSKKWKLRVDFQLLCSTLRRGARKVSSRPKAAQIRKPRPGRVRCLSRDMSKGRTKTRSPSSDVHPPCQPPTAKSLDLDFTVFVGLLVCFFLRRDLDVLEETFW